MPPAVAAAPRAPKPRGRVGVAGAAPKAKEGKKPLDPLPSEGRRTLERDQLLRAEERARTDTEATERALRKQMKVTRRGAFHRVVGAQTAAIADLQDRLRAAEAECRSCAAAAEERAAGFARSVEDLEGRLGAAEERAETQAHELESARGTTAQLRDELVLVAEEGRVQEAEAAAALEEVKQAAARQATEGRVQRVRAMEAELDADRRVQRLEADLRKALASLIRDCEAHEHAAGPVEAFVDTLDRAEGAYLTALRAAESRAAGISGRLLDFRSMHSPLPPHVRDGLQAASPEELRLIIDGLAFEESVLPYLLARFPRP